MAKILNQIKTIIQIFWERNSESTGESPNLLDGTEQYLNDVIDLHCKDFIHFREENYEIMVFKNILTKIVLLMQSLPLIVWISPSKKHKNQKNR